MPKITMSQRWSSVVFRSVHVLLFQQVPSLPYNQTLPGRETPAAALLRVGDPGDN